MPWQMDDPTDDVTRPRKPTEDRDPCPAATV
jgi:hypothetical protein